MRQDEAALGVVVLHREDAIQPDARIRSQPREQTLAPGVPEGVPETPATELGPNNEKAHEAEVAAVSGDSTAADQLAFEVRGNEGLGIRRPEQPGIVRAGALTFPRRPIDEGVHLGRAHVPDDKRAGHGGVLIRLIMDDAVSRPEIAPVWPPPPRKQSLLRA